MDITAAQAKQLLAENPAVLDVRTPEEHEEGHLPSALNIDIYSNGFQQEIAGLDRHSTYLVYCRTGHRSRAAVELMAQLGFKKVFHLASGILDWQAVGLPTAKTI